LRAGSGYLIYTKSKLGSLLSIVVTFSISLLGHLISSLFIFRMLYRFLLAMSWSDIDLLF